MPNGAACHWHAQRGARRRRASGGWRAPCGAVTAMLKQYCATDCRNTARRTCRAPRKRAPASAPCGEFQRRLPQCAAMKMRHGGGGVRRRAGSARGPRMNPSALFIHRPVATSLLMIAIMLVGLVGYPVPAALGAAGSRLPDHPGADLPARRQPRSDDHVGHRAAGTPVRPDAGPQPDVVGQFGRRLDHHAAIRSQPQSRHRRAGGAGRDQCRGNLLPQSLPAPPVYAKVNPADAPILTIWPISSKTMPLTQVEDLADTRIAQKISQLPGVGLVSINGGQRPAVRVQANLQALAAYGLNIDDLRTTIANANSNAPKGSFDGAAQSYTINANDQLQSRRRLQEHRRRLQERRAGASVRRRDVVRERREREAARAG